MADEFDQDLTYGEDADWAGLKAVIDAIVNGAVFSTQFDGDERICDTPGCCEKAIPGFLYCPQCDRA